MKWTSEIGNTGTHIWPWICRIYSNVIFWIAYCVSWFIWQCGGKQIRRAIAKSYDDIEQEDVLLSLCEDATDPPDPQLFPPISAKEYK